jgi:hypothetical protein
MGFPSFYSTPCESGRDLWVAFPVSTFGRITNIQASGSQKVLAHNKSLKITLLSLPMDFVSIIHFFPYSGNFVRKCESVR